MATLVKPAWAYRSRSNDPPLKWLVNDMTDSIGKVDSVDSVICPFASYVFPNADGSASLIELSQNRLTVDYFSLLIRMPKLPLSVPYLPSSVDDNLIRYAAFIIPPDCDTFSKAMHVVVLSMWQQQNRDIHNIYLVMSESDALLLLNAVSRLVSRLSMIKAHEFYPLITGKVLLSNCTSTRHSLTSTDCCSPQSLMFFILDPESLSFFEHDFSNKPTYDFRFYKEKGPRSIDIIFVSKDSSNIHLRQGNQICIIRQNVNSETDQRSYDTLLNMLKENIIKPKPEDYFTSPAQQQISVEAPQQIGGGASRHVTFGTSQQLDSSWQASNELYMNEQWLNDLYTGDHINKNVNEEMQLMWCTFEHDLKECINIGAVPFSTVESGGLDPHAHSHLQRSVEDIKDQLLNNNMVLAMSRLEACRRVFRDTLLRPVSKLDHVELMKRIYFLSGRD